jgi:hypothetical protein
MILVSNLGRDKRFFSSPAHPDKLWEPPCKNMKLTTDVHVLEIFSFMNVLAP